MADTYDLSIDCGSTYQLLITWTTPAGAAINITGYTARMKMKNKHGGTTLVSLTDSDGLTLGGSAGTVAVLISAARTAALSGTGVYDVEVESSGGIVTRILEGTWSARPEVTD